MNDDSINFTINEQNCLAEVCQVMSSFAYKTLTNSPDVPDIKDKLSDIVLMFPNTNWGGLYDKFHRQGKNK